MTVAGRMGKTFAPWRSTGSHVASCVNERNVPGCGMSTLTRRQGRSGEPGDQSMGWMSSLTMRTKSPTRS